MPESLKVFGMPRNCSVLNSVVVGHAVPIDFRVLEVCGCGLAPKMPAQPPHNPRTTPLLPMILVSHTFCKFCCAGCSRCPWPTGTRVAPESLKCKDILHFHGLGGVVKAVGDPRIIGNTQSSKHSHGLFERVRGAGDPRIIENGMISIHFRDLFGWAGPRAAPESLNVHRCTHCHGVGAAGDGLFGGVGAREVPESSKTCRSMHVHGLFGGVGGAGGPRIIANT